MTQQTLIRALPLVDRAADLDQVPRQRQGAEHEVVLGRDLEEILHELAGAHLEADEIRRRLQAETLNRQYLFDQIPVASVSTDRNAVILAANQPAAELFNAANSGTVLQRYQRTGRYRASSGSFTPSQFFDQILEVQSPRIVRLGLQVNF